MKKRKIIRQFYRGNGTLLAMGMGAVLTEVTSNLLTAWLLQQLIDLTTGGSGYPFSRLCLLAAASMGLLMLSFLLAYHSQPRFVAKAIGRYQTYAFGEISRKSIRAFSGENTAIYISTLSNDARTVEQGYLSNLFLLCRQGAVFAGALAMMLWYSVPLTVVSLLFSLVPMLTSLLAGNRVAEAEEEVSRRSEEYMSTLKDSLTGFSVVKAFRAEAELCRLFDENIGRVTEAKQWRRKMSVLVEALATCGGWAAQIGVFAVSSWMALSGWGISPGMVIAFVQLMNWVVQPIAAVPRYLAEMKAASALIGKLADSLDSNIRKEGEKVAGELHSGIEVKNLTFGYGEAPVLKDLNVSFEAGKRYAIVGASGSGKSTLLHLLMAAYDGYEGDILYDGVELRRISSESLYEMVSMVQQNVFMFNASIRDNITMFRSFPKEEVQRAIQMAGLSDLIAERGEEYRCGENGISLSGGEKQRIAIARSLLQGSSVLLADEATAALDAETARQVSEAILSLTGLTRIVVTHSLEESLLKQYDCILAFKKGRLEELGTFEELMEKKGYFYSLYTVAQ